MDYLSFIFTALITYFLNFIFVDCGSPLIILEPCQEGLFYYQHYAVYKCIDGHKLFQNCVPLNEPHSLAIAINTTYITPHFRSICVQYEKNNVQYIRTHCVEGTRFMKPNTNLEFPNRKVECLFDQNIQTLRKLITYKRIRRICRHKKDTKLVDNVHYTCKQNAYWPDYCVGTNSTSGTEIRLPIGALQSDGYNYVFQCKSFKTSLTNISTSALSLGRSKKKKSLPNKVVLGPIRIYYFLLKIYILGCAHYFNSSLLPVAIEIGHQLEFPEGNAIIHCLNNSGWARKLIVPKVPKVSDDCLFLYGQNIYTCHGFIYQWSLTNQIELIGCADPTNLINWIPLGKKLTIKNNIVGCGYDGLIYLGCVSSSGKYLKFGENEGNPAGGGNGLFEKCEKGKGLIKYYETHCLYGDIIILPGHFFIAPVNGASLGLRLVCEKQRLSLGNNLTDNLNHKAFWYVTMHKDCIDSYGGVIPIGGFSYHTNIQNSILSEFCLHNGVQIEKPIGCKFGQYELKPTDKIINSHDILQCFPNGKITKIGCYFEPKNITLALGQVEPLPDNHDVLIYCEINSTGISFKNGVKSCLKEETGEEFPFGSTDEDSDSIRTCVRKIEPQVHGEWELTHCLFGTIKVPKGSCFFNITKEEKNNKTNCNLNETKERLGVYKLCEQDKNSKPVFLDASFEYCSPTQIIKATDQFGQILETHVEKFKKTSFECDSNWGPKPLPIELENATEEDEMNDEYIDEYSDEEEEELKTAEEIENTKRISLLEVNPLKQIIINKQNNQLETPKINETKQSFNLLTTNNLQQEILLPLSEEAFSFNLEENNKLIENLTTEANIISTTTIETKNKLENLILSEEIKLENKPENMTTEEPLLLTTTTEENNKLGKIFTEIVKLEENIPQVNKTENLMQINFEENKLENLTSTTTIATTFDENILESFIITEEEIKPENKLETSTNSLNNFSTTQLGLINDNITIEEFTEEIIEEVVIAPTTDLPLIKNKTEEKNFEQTTHSSIPTTELSLNKSDQKLESEFNETNSNKTTNVLSSSFDQEIYELTNYEVPFPEQEYEETKNKPELFDNNNINVISNSFNASQGLATKIVSLLNENITQFVKPIPAPPLFKAIDLLLQINLEKIVKSNEYTTKVHECRNRLSEHFCTAFKSMCLFPTGDSAIKSIPLVHTLHYLRHFIGGNNMRSNLHFAISFLNTGLAKTPIDKQQITKMIYKIGGLLNLIPSEDDLAELLLSAEGGPILERMLQLKKESSYQCGLSRLDCTAPSASNFVALRCKKKWQNCVRERYSKLAKEFEILLWNFRSQLVPYPHGAVWVLCAKTCGKCLPVAIADGLIESWKEYQISSLESGNK